MCVCVFEHYFVVHVRVCVSDVEVCESKVGCAPLLRKEVKKEVVQLHLLHILLFINQSL